jgi:hypothetical protein
METKKESVRFSDAPFYLPGVNVTLGGLGGIGSWLSLLLNRLECKIYAYEYDTVDETNMGGQLYSLNQVGKTKFEASLENAKYFANEKSMESLGKFTESSFVTPITFSAFDNMLARKLMFQKWRSLNDREIFIDGRMNMQNGQIFVVKKGQENDYIETLFDDSEVEDQPCSAKATSHSGAFIASLMTAAYTNYISFKKDPDFELPIPFKTTYDFPLFQIESL